MNRMRTRGFLAPIVSLCMVALFAAGCGELTGPKSPSTPTGVTATLLSATSVMVTWTPSPQNDGVVSYSVFRNGTKVGESKTTSYTDTGLTQLQTYKYTIAANCTSGLISDQSVETAASTIVTRDVTPPTVISHQPPTGFQGVSPGATVTATFSEPMDSASVTASFNLKVTGGAAIPGTVTYTPATRIAEFKPAGLLPNITATNITATVTTGAKDLAGNRLAADFAWGFTTRDDTAPIVIAATPPNGSTGVSPSVAPTVTFSEAMDATTITAANMTLKVTSSGAAVAGAVSYNATTRVATFTPSVPLNQSSTYTFTVAGAVKDVAGNQMGVPFNLTFSTGDTTAPTVVSVSPANGATGVATNATVQVTFSEAMDPATITAATVSLKNTSTGVAVVSSVSYNTTTNVATLTPTAALSNLTNYTVTVTTGVKDLAGNALASQFNSTFSTLPAPDTTAPTVVTVSPPNAALNIATTTTVQVTFSEAMDPTTINAATVSLKNTATSAAVASTVTYNAATNVATLTPTGPLSNSTQYTVTVTTGAKDLAGNALASAFTSSFTTVPAPDTTAPTIVSRSPAPGATGVATNTTATVTFSEPMDATTINTTNIKLTETATSTAVAGSVTYNAGTNTATFTPTAALNNNTSYTLTVTTGVKDVAGNGLAAQSTSTFTTAPDTTAPVITGNSPANGTVNVPVTSVVTVTFSENMDATTINGTNFKLNFTVGGAAVAGAVTYNVATKTATFTPTAALTANTNYTATVTTGVKDSAGNPLAFNATFSFTTAP